MIGMMAAGTSTILNMLSTIKQQVRLTPPVCHRGHVRALQSSQGRQVTLQSSRKNADCQLLRAFVNIGYRPRSFDNKGNANRELNTECKNFGTSMSTFNREQQVVVVSVTLTADGQLHDD